MPCNSDYMEATGFEIEMSRVFQLLDLVEGKRAKIDRDSWNGYDKRVYGVFMRTDAAHKIVARLCAACKKMSERDMKNMPLELQMWWRDHQKADKKREKEEQNKQREKAVLTRAKAKLSREELTALYRSFARTNKILEH